MNDYPLTLNELFLRCERAMASDIHLSPGEPPYMRTQGVLARVPGAAVLTPSVCLDFACALVAELLGDKQGNPVAETSRRLEDDGSIDGATTSPAGFRYRYNIFRENGATALAFRRLDDQFLSLKELGVFEQLESFCAYPDGLVIVTGPTGSGKSTTIATLIDMINRNRRSHIITIEDPIEYTHQSIKSLVQQRQIGRDAVSFNSALVESLRQDPDVIFVGEIREIETMRTAITAAETGHLVFTTLHAGDCVGAIERFVSVFPEGEQSSVRYQLSLVLRGIFAQHLLPSAKPGLRRVACGELLFVSDAVSNLIATGKSRQIYSMMETGRSIGMVTLDQDLARLLSAGLITVQAARALSRNPQELSSWTFASTKGGES